MSKKTKDLAKDMIDHAKEHNIPTKKREKPKK